MQQNVYKRSGKTPDVLYIMPVVLVPAIMAPSSRNNHDTLPKLTLGSYVVSRVSRRMVPVKITVEKSGDIVKADLAQELKRKPKAAPAPAGKSAAEQKKQAPAANAAASQPSKGTAKQTDASKKAASTPQKPAGGKTAPTGSTDKKVS